MYNASQIADWFINQADVDSGDTLSHLKLQKLVYYAQAWHYTIHGEALFEEPIQAWKRGPVVRSLYDRFSSVLPYNSILPIYQQLDLVEFPEKTEALLDDIKHIYGEHSGAYLEDLTHQEDPWIIARAGLPNYANCENEITLASMKEYYSQKLDGQAQA